MRLVPEVALLDDETLERHADQLAGQAGRQRCGPELLAALAAKGWQPRAILLGQLVAAALNEGADVAEADELTARRRRR